MKNIDDLNILNNKCRLFIEIKKGKSIWLDEVRYCEIFMSENIDNEECKKKQLLYF